MTEPYTITNGTLHVDGMEPMPVATNPVTVLDQINVRRLMLHVGDQIKESLAKNMGCPGSDEELRAFHAAVSERVERHRPMMEAAGIRVTSIDTYREGCDRGVKIATSLTPTAPVDYIEVSFKVRPMFQYLPTRLRKRAWEKLVADVTPKAAT
jgi:hypothetical protein